MNRARQCEICGKRASPLSSPVIAPLVFSTNRLISPSGRSPFNPANHPFNANFDPLLYNDCLIVPQMVYSAMASRIILPSAKHPRDASKSFRCHPSEECARNSFPCHTSEVEPRKSLACHTSEKRGGWGPTYGSTTLPILRKSSREVRQVAGCGGRCHNPASRLQSVFRSDLRLRNMGNGG